METEQTIEKRFVDKLILDTKSKRILWTYCKSRSERGPVYATTLSVESASPIEGPQRAAVQIHYDKLTIHLERSNEGYTSPVEVPIVKDDLVRLHDAVKDQKSPSREMNDWIKEYLRS